MPTRLISFAGTTLALEYQGQTAARIIDLLYRHVAAGDGDSSPVIYHLGGGNPSEKLRVQRGETVLYEGHCAGTAAELLLGDSCYQLAAHCHTGLLFHAAALSKQGRTLVLPGPSGTGKSTLTAWLVSQGFDYLSDELVLIPWQTNTVQAFTRPLSLKKPARPVLSRRLDFEEHSAHILSSAYVDLVPPALLANTPCKKPPAAWNNPIIIFPQYHSAGSFEWQPLSKAGAGLALMEQLINARNLPNHGMTEAARIAGCIPAYRMKYSDFEPVMCKLETVLP